jgi:ABC-2 type transport system ATP-binding protein
MASIRTAGLTKDFGHLRAVNEIDLDLPEGGVAGFVGPNGAVHKGTIWMLFVTEPAQGARRQDPCAHDLHRGRDRYPETTD